jgi:hypothetical protein
VNRVVWFAAGAGAGVYAMVKARRTAEAFTPDGLRDRLAGLSVGAHLFGDEVRTGMVEKETELRRRLAARIPELSASTSEKPASEKPAPAKAATREGQD